MSYEVTDHQDMLEECEVVEPVLLLTVGRRPDLGTLTAASTVRQRLPPSLELSSHKAASHNESFIPQSGL